MTIPKIIHYVWVGPKKPSSLVKKCIASWKKYLPDYEIIEWNERNFDINSNRYCREAYDAKKYAFVSDYIRIAVLYQYGGIYMDTDVEVVKPFSDDILNCEAIACYESPKTIQTGLLGSVPGQKFMGLVLDHYRIASFVNTDGTYNMIPNVQVITNIAKENGLDPDGQLKNCLGLTLFPQTFFCPLCNYCTEICFTENTYTIHHFSGSWCNRKTRFVGIWNRKYGKTCTRIFGTKGAELLYRIVYNVCRLIDSIRGD